MKFLDTHCEDYIKSVDKYNLHPHLKKSFPDDIADLQNMILYGPAGVGKYSQALFGIRKYSATDLKYERKLNIRYGKNTYNIKISDIHFEVDLSLLGCNAKVLWYNIYTHILDIVSTRPNSTGIIICKNFHNIHSELLDVFYSYMQSLSHLNVKLIYILITEHSGLIPFNIINRSVVLSLRRPSKRAYEKCIGKSLQNTKLSSIINIKNLSLKLDDLNSMHKFICDKIINIINNYKDLNFLVLRETLYELFIYDIDMPESIWYILTHFIKSNQLSKDKLFKILIKLYPFLKYFNNNYRPIYHLENFIIYLCKTIHEF